MALCVGTTVIIKSGQGARYAWVTLLPLAWLLVVTLTASWQKVLSPDPSSASSSLADRTMARVNAGEMAGELGRQVAFNARLDAALTTDVRGGDAFVVVASAQGVVAGDPRTEAGACGRKRRFVETAYAG